MRTASTSCISVLTRRAWVSTSATNNLCLKKIQENFLYTVLFTPCTRWPFIIGSQQTQTAAVKPPCKKETYYDDRYSRHTERHHFTRTVLRSCRPGTFCRPR